MNIMTIIFSILILNFLSGCKQDPYPTEGKLRVIQRQEDDPTPPALSISIRDNIQYSEGRFKKTEIRVEVEEPGEPIVTIDNLPEGAVFDPETLTLEWRPNFSQGNDPNDPTALSYSYPITIWLGSTILPESQRESREIHLMVADTPRMIDIESLDKYEVRENEELKAVINISNEDFPQGPFKLYTKDMPANFAIKRISSTQFELSFKPDFYHVNLLKNKKKNYKIYKGSLIVSNPSNQTRLKKMELKVIDVRRKSDMVIPGDPTEPRDPTHPRELTQGLDMSFQVASYDNNKEVSPKLALLGVTPRFGKFRIEEVKKTESYLSVLNVFWNDIPPRYNGTVQQLQFRSCVLDARGIHSNCVRKSINIKIIVRDRIPPKIVRTSWPRDELVYLGFKEELNREIKVIDGEDLRSTPKVEVFPVEMRDYVEWKGNNLKLNFPKAGVFQFGLIATSDYNMSSSESFIVEVFPKSRKRILLFADSTRDPEAMFYKKAFKNSMNIMNPAIQEINLRNIKDRDTLVLTTSTLLDESVQDEVLRGIDHIKHVVVATPLIHKLPKKFLNRLKEEYDLLPIGRYSELPNMPPLKEIKIVATSQFDIPTNDVKLKGSATNASRDPMIFNGGLYDTDKICKGVLGLSKTGNNPYVLGLTCRRKKGGRISILGTEWADFLTSVNDKEIPQKWFNTLLKGKF